MRTFLEGVDAIRLPCTLAILVPGIIVILAAGRRAGFAFAGFLLGLSVIAWARFTDSWLAGPGPAALAGLGLLVMGSVVATGLSRQQRPEFVAPFGVAIGATTAWLWQPCVGPRLGDILNNAPDAPFAEIAPLVAYLVGATSIALALVIAPTAWPPLAGVRDHPATARVGIAAGALLGGAIAVGVYDDLVAELVRRSSR